MPNKLDHYAYPHSPALEAVMRLSAVKRWHMIDTTRTQNLAEHSANVAALAYMTARTAPGMAFGSSHYAAAAALFHDIDEVFIGDIPTHSKRWLDQDGLDRAANEITPPELRQECPKVVADLVKLCDLADGIRFIRIHGVDMTATHAQEGLERQYWKKILEFHPLSEEALYHAICQTYFYAYEAGVGAAPLTFPTDAWNLVTDLARRQGNHAGGPGSELRHAFPWTRDRVAGTEGEQVDGEGCYPD